MFRSTVNINSNQHVSENIANNTDTNMCRSLFVTQASITLNCTNVVKRSMVQMSCSCLQLKVGLEEERIYISILYKIAYQTLCVRGEEGEKKLLLVGCVASSKKNTTAAVLVGVGWDCCCACVSEGGCVVVRCCRCFLFPLLSLSPTSSHFSMVAVVVLGSSVGDKQKDGELP